MVYVKYDVRFCIEHTGKTMGTLDFITSDLKEVFDQLYEEVVATSIKDPITDEISVAPEMLNKINIAITKKRVKACYAGLFFLKSLLHPCFNIHSLV